MCFALHNYKDRTLVFVRSPNRSAAALQVQSRAAGSCTQRGTGLELQSMSGLGVRPARISARQCDTTRCQYCSVSGTTRSSTPAASHTCASAAHEVAGPQPTPPHAASCTAHPAPASLPLSKQTSLVPANLHLGWHKFGRDPPTWQNMNGCTSQSSSSYLQPAHLQILGQQPGA